MNKLLKKLEIWSLGGTFSIIDYPKLPSLAENNTCIVENKFSTKIMIRGFPFKICTVGSKCNHKSHAVSNVYMCSNSGSYL